MRTVKIQPSPCNRDVEFSQAVSVEQHCVRFISQNALFPNKAAQDVHALPAPTLAWFAGGGTAQVMNDLMNTKKGRKTKDRAARLATLLGTLRETIDLMGLPVGDGAAQRVLQELRQTALTRAEMTEEDIALKVEARKEARAAKASRVSRCRCCLFYRTSQLGIGVV